MNEAARMKEALLSYAAFGPLDTVKPGQLQRDLRSIAGEKHYFKKMISDDRCFICRHDIRHEVHNGDE